MSEPLLKKMMMEVAVKTEDPVIAASVVNTVYKVVQEDQKDLLSMLEDNTIAPLKRLDAATVWVKENVGRD